MLGQAASRAPLTRCFLSRPNDSNDCYKEYLSIKIKDGQADKIGCPAYKCKQTVPESVIKDLVDEDVFKKYNSFLANSYVENNPYVMWCPAPGMIIPRRAYLFRSEIGPFY